jgi:hypothetical protein
MSYPGISVVSFSVKEVHRAPNGAGPRATRRSGIYYAMRQSQEKTVIRNAAQASKEERSVVLAARSTATSRD